MRELPLPECYRLLELPPGASLAEVREAYRVLTRVWHPDRFVGAPDLSARANRRQQELNAAYQSLCAHLEGGGPAPSSSPDDVVQPLSHGPAASTSSDESSTPPAATGRPGDPGLPPRPAARPFRGAAIPAFVRSAAAWARTHPRRAAGGASALTLAVVLLAGGLRDRGVRTEGGSPLPARVLAVGGGHGCGAGAAGVMCWGSSLLGQAGSAVSTRRWRAVPMALPAPATLLAAGLAHSCALLANGEVYCWGGNFAGQLGDGSLTDRGQPRPVGRPGPFRTLSSLARHTCAVGRSGGLYCWGDDTDGQVGAGAPVAQCRLDDLRFHCADLPQRVGTAANWSSVAAGGSHTCALDQDGQLWCWGSNRHGQLGSATTDVCRGPGGAQPCRRTPLRVSGLSVRLEQIVAGASHSCALDRVGRAWCWGLNTFGQAGARDSTQLSSPRALDTTLRFTALAAGGYHTCGRTADGALHCWGRDEYGELRHSGLDRCGEARCALTPVRIADGVEAVAAGLGGTCIALSDGVRCWGEGDPLLEPEPTPAGTSVRTGLARAWAELSWTAGTMRRFVLRTLNRLDAAGR